SRMCELALNNHTCGKKGAWCKGPTSAKGPCSASREQTSCPLVGRSDAAPTNRTAVRASDYAARRPEACASEPPRQSRGGHYLAPGLAKPGYVTGIWAGYQAVDSTAVCDAHRHCERKSARATS